MIKAGKASSSSIYEGYVRFNMSQTGLPADAYPDAAQLRLLADPHPTTAMTLGVGKANSTWSESTTWNNRPGSTQLATVNIPTSSYSQVVWAAGTALTTAVKDWYWYAMSGGYSGAPNYGFKVYQTSSAYTSYSFHSRHATDGDWPRLDIYYHVPTVTITTDRASVREDDAEVVSAVVAVNTGNTSTVGDVRDVWLTSSDWQLAAFRWDGSSFSAVSSTYVTPLIDQWTVTTSGTVRYVTFKWKVKPTYAGTVPQTLHADVYIGAGERWWGQVSGPSLNVVPALVTPAANARGLDWWRAPDRDGDGVADRLDDQPKAGRGAIDLSWTGSGLATGYKVMMFDGNAYQQVGQVEGSASTTWSTEGAGIYPSDTRVSSVATGYVGNPFFRVATPKTPDDSIDLSSLGAGLGLVVADGSYLYARRFASSGAVTQWHKIGTGLAGTTKGEDYGAVGAASGHDALSAFYLDGFIYEGYATSASSIAGIWKGASGGATATRPLHFSAPLLARSTGVPLTGPSADVLLTCDSEHIYSVAQQRDGGSFNGWRVRAYDRDGAWLGDHDIGTASYLTNGVLADGENLYLIEWTGTDAARVSKVSTSGWKVRDRWTLAQSNHAVGGTYDAANNAFWLGSLDTGAIYRYPGPGLDVRDDPKALYARMGAGAYANFLNYWFRIVPYNSGGDAGQLADCPAATPTLPNRTVGANDDVRHASYHVGDLLHHSQDVQFERGSLELDVTDLSIASFGPDASLSRHYSSSTTAATSFAPGWRFGFERAIEPSTTTYVDEAGDRHRFVHDAASGAYFAPVGYWATLTTTAAGYDLAFKDRSHLQFSPQGVLVSEVDRNGNRTDYVRMNGDLVIAAANGQSITVRMDGLGHVLSAVYATADGTRTVSYCAGAGYAGGPSADVSYFSGTTDAYAAVYAYGTSGDATGRLTSLEIPQFQWGTAKISFGYGAPGITGWTITPGFWQPVSGSITYGTLQATVTDTGKAGGAETGGTFALNPTGTLASTGAGWSYSYDPTNEQMYSHSPGGAEEHSQRDARGNVLYSWDQDGRRTRYVYDDADQVIRETDPRGCTTYRSYDPAGNLLSEDRQLGASERSHVSYTYNATDFPGLVSAEYKQLNATTTAETDYGDFAPCGEAQAVWQPGVKLSADSEPVTLVTTKHYDAFGNLTWEKDATGRWVAKNKTYTISGRLASSEVVTGTITRYRYNRLGQTWETSTTAGGQTIDWTMEVYDPRGVRTDLAKKDETNVLRTAESSHLTARGNVDETQYWDDTGYSFAYFGYDGRDNRTTEQLNWDNPRITRYDASDRPYVVIEPGNSASQATTTTYDASGRTVRVDNPDGTWVTSAYDEGGNVVCETKPTEGGAASVTSVYDVGGRLVATTNEVSGTTTFGYDLADRQIASGIVGKGGSSTAYNAAGWAIIQTDADGIVTKTSYDAAGRLTALDVGGKITTTAYDDAGRVASVTDPDGKALHFAYDAFSRKVREWHAQGGATTRDIRTAYDSLSRVVETSETAGTYERTTTYNGVSEKPLSSVLTYADTTSSVTFDGARGLESNRSVSAGAISLSRSVSHDDQGRVKDITITGLGSQHLTYDGASHITAQTGLGWGGVGAGYTYGDAGRKTAESLSLAATTTPWTADYAYTDDGRLAQATIDSATTTYAYDAAGNLTTVCPSGAGTSTLVYEAGNRLTQMGSTLFGWDPAQGRRTSTRRSGEASVTYTFSDGGRLVSYSDPNRDASATFTYDADGQRDSAVLHEGSLATTTTYTYAGLSLLSLAAERSDGATYSLAYFYDESGRPFSAVYAASDASPTLVHLVTTDRGDVVELLNATGTPIATYRYDAWGNPLSSWASADSTVAAAIATRQPLRYAGYCYDSFSALYYLSARYYDPATMQFISKDPAKADGEESAYQYCGGNPVQSVDRSGLAWESSPPYWAQTKAYLFLGYGAGWVSVTWEARWTWYCDGGTLYFVASARVLSGGGDAQIWFDAPYQVRKPGGSTYWASARLTRGRWTWGVAGPKCYAGFESTHYSKYWIRRAQIVLSLVSNHGSGSNSRTIECPNLIGSYRR